MTEFRNSGTALLCGIICIWPLIVTFSYRAIERRVKSQGWRSLLPPYKRHDVTL